MEIVVHTDPCLLGIDIMDSFYLPDDQTIRQMVGCQQFAELEHFQLLDKFRDRWGCPEYRLQFFGDDEYGEQDGVAFVEGILGDLEIEMAEREHQARKRGRKPSELEPNHKRCRHL